MDGRSLAVHETSSVPPASLRRTTIALATAGALGLLSLAVGCGGGGATGPDMNQGKNDTAPGQDGGVNGQDTAQTGVDMGPLADVVITSPDVPVDGGNLGGFSTQSSPIAINPDKDRLWVVYPDLAKVGVFKIDNDSNSEAAVLSTGKEPWSVTFSGNGKAYVANFGDNTVTCFTGADAASAKTIPVGHEPIAISASADGKKIYVANLADNSVTVIDPAGPDCSTDTVLTTITNVPEPSAISALGTFVFVTRLRAGYVGDPASSEVNDLGRQGEVTVINGATASVVGTVILPPLADTGFSVPPTMDGGAPTPTGAFPNILAGIAFKANKGYVTSIGSSPKGPLKFNFDIQSLLSVFDPTALGTPAKVLNMNKGSKLDKAAAPAGQAQNFPFLANPWAIAFRSDDAPVGYVTASAVDQLIRFQIEANTGVPAVETAGVVKRLKTGQNPRGIVINQDNTRLYVMNYVSRDVTVVDLANFGPLSVGGVDKGTMSGTIGQPPTSDAVHQGNLQFHSAIGANYESPDDPGVINGAADPAKKEQFALSNFGWMSCASCHPFGREDGVTWAFATGPRRTIPLTSSFSKESDIAARKVKILNWTALNDEVQDFENNSKNVAGGRGLIVDATGTAQAAAPFINAAGAFVMNSGRPNAKVPELAQDNMEAFLRTLRGPTAPSGLDAAAVAAGRTLFAKANCVACHGGPHWGGTVRTWDPPAVAGGPITNPPALSDFFNDMIGMTPAIQFLPALRKVGTFDPANPLEKRQDGVVAAQGDHGFNSPSLFGVASRAPYLHHGQARTLEDVVSIDDQAHMQAGNCAAGATTQPGCTPNAALLAAPADFTALIAFVKSIDDTTVPCSATPTTGPQLGADELLALCQ